MNRLNWRNWLIDPRVRCLDPDSPGFTAAHRRVLQDKPMLRQLFEGFYRECRAVDERFFGGCRGGRRAEIGSGSSFMRQMYPDVITSDIKLLSFVDVVFRAEAMPFPDDSMRAIYAINVFHHLPEPRMFFAELLRVLLPGGGVVLIEPHYGPVASWLFRRMHASEFFEPEAPGWTSVNYTGPASGANQALSYIVFKRDRARFLADFPNLELVLDRPHTHLLYLVSGGVNFRQLVPSSFTSAVKLCERLVSPLNPWLSLQHTVVVRKRLAAES